MQSVDFKLLLEGFLGSICWQMLQGIYKSLLLALNHSVWSLFQMTCMLGTHTLLLVLLPKALSPNLEFVPRRRLRDDFHCPTNLSCKVKWPNELSRYNSSVLKIKYPPDSRFVAFLYKQPQQCGYKHIALFEDYIFLQHLFVAPGSVFEPSSVCFSITWLVDGFDT